MSAWPPRDRIEFGSLLAYSPRLKDDPSHELMIYLKNNLPLKDGSETACATAHLLRQKIGRESVPFSDFFLGHEAVLIPVPKSSLMKPGDLWVPLEIAGCMEKEGLGRVQVALERVKSVPRSATSAPKDRPLPRAHYESLGIVKRRIPDGAFVVLVDDIVTRGHTMFGAAMRILDEYPGVTVVGFAAMRTVSNPSEFRNLYDPVRGEIVYREERGDTLRRP
ncbi:MAG: phosphoribosyltransferase [Conexivisphaera sp.]